MARIKAILDEYGIIKEGVKSLPDDSHKVQFLEALAELEDNSCHVAREFPKTRLHLINGYKKSVYRADINKISGWRIHLQYDKNTGYLKLKDIIPGQKHDDALKVIKSKSGRYE
jgi:hypothetical protein